MGSLKESRGRIADIRVAMEALKKELKQNGTQLLGEEFKEFFAANKNIVALRWTQYTPYFNDGDPCKFGVNDCEVKYLYGETSTEDEDGFCYISHYSPDKRSKPAVQFWNTICDEEIMEAIFGDHVQITVSREGFEVDEYDHD